MSGRIDREEVKRAYLEGSDSFEAIAARFGISDRTIYRWSNEDPEGNWPTLRKARKVVSARFDVNTTPTPQDYPQVRARRSRRGEPLDDLEIVEIAIMDVSAMMAGDSMDSRGIGSCASALCRLIELRRKISPPSAADLAEQVIALGINPSEFVAELKKRWQQTA